jgi:hypothetical protein
MKKVTWNDKYVLGGGLGSWAKSFENRVEEGDVRLIDGVLMYAYTVYRRSFGPDEVNWSPVDGKFNTFENLKKWLGQ